MQTCHNLHKSAVGMKCICETTQCPGGGTGFVVQSQKKGMSVRNWKRTAVYFA